MPSFNSVQLIGNLTRDPQVKQLPTTMIAEFGIATSRKFKASDGAQREEVCFVDCAAFGGQAETIAKYCRKGRSLFIRGRLKFDSWDDKSGSKRSKLSVVVEEFQFLGSRPDSEQRDDGRTVDRSTDQTREVEPPFGDEAKFTDDEIPF